MNLRAWLQLFRAQTVPATLLLVLVPYLTNAPFFDIKLLFLALYSIATHYFSFGHNSLMDFALGYDQKDPSKQHHPLISGEISLHIAHKVIHFGQILLTFLAVYISFVHSPNFGLALATFSIFMVSGYAYNCGLSKESILGFLPISLCFTCLGAWAWFLSHNSINQLGWLLLAYFFMTILFQISWSGHLKELELRERSNILTKMGAKVDVTWKGEKVFVPGKAWIYGWFIKAFNIILGGVLCFYNFTFVRLVYWVLLASATLFYLHKLTKPRVYRRNRELLSMSVMEILTIYTPIPLVLPWFEAIILMAVGVVYFFGMNLWLWRVPHPAV